jgi:hypothetical protein
MKPGEAYVFSLILNSSKAILKYQILLGKKRKRNKWILDCYYLKDAK